MVAWCSKPGHGTRLIPDSALTGLQLLVSPSGLTLNGFLSNQSLINMAEGDYGGEMDPHGADLVCLLLARMVTSSDAVICLAWKPYGGYYVFELLQRHLYSNYRMDEVYCSIPLRSCPL